MKSVLISIRPKWCELIASGEKTVEIRKTRTKLKTPFKCYIYCTKGGKNLIRGDIATTIDYVAMYGGKVIGEFICDKIYDVAPLNKAPEDLEDQACMSREEIVRYLSGVGYAWHISSLFIYNEPKILSEFWKPDKCLYASKDGCRYEYYCDRVGKAKRCGEIITRPPQSWCYVEEVSHDNQ